MDYLRRLYPGQAEPPGVARLDLAPAFFGPRPAAADEPTAMAAVQALGERRVDRPAAPGPAPREPEVPVPTVRPAIEAAPATPSLPTPPKLPAAADRVAPREMRSSPGMAPSIPGQGRPADPALARVDTAAAAAPTAARGPGLDRPAPPAGAVPSTQAPLRISTVLQAAADRERTTEPAPVVHVTIDRIDVRLPSAPATAAAPARRRPVSAVGGLGDYLRGRAPEDRR